MFSVDRLLGFIGVSLGVSQEEYLKVLFTYSYLVQEPCCVRFSLQTFIEHVLHLKYS